MTNTKATLLYFSIPDPTTPLTDISSTYLETIKSALHAVQPSPSGIPIISRLDIAASTTIPLSNDLRDSSRTSAYNTFQHLLSSIYSLVCTAAIQAQCDLDYPGGVDVRVFIVTPDSSASPADTLSGPLVQQTTLAQCLSTRYTQILTPNEPTTKREAESLLHSSTTDLSNLTIQTLPVHSDIKALTSRPTASPQHHPPPTQHHKVAVGGTFDHIHLGHKLLLTSTIFLASPTTTTNNNNNREITVGITNASLLVAKTHAAELESWETRQQRCEDLVESILCFHPDPDSIKSTVRLDEPGPNGKVVVVEYSVPVSDGPATAADAGAKPVYERITIRYTCITDPYGPTVTDESITAIVVSGETRAGGDAVNNKRREKGWRELEVFEVQVLDSSIAAAAGDSEKKDKATGFEGKLSSTEIRRKLAAARQTQTQTQTQA